MNNRIATAFLSLLGSLFLVGLGWWLHLRELWAGAAGLVVAGGLLAAFFTIRLVLRIGRGNRPTPID